MATSEVPERFAYTIAEVARLLNLGRSTVYELIQAGRIDVLRIGRAVRVPKSSLAKFLGVPADELTLSTALPPASLTGAVIAAAPLMASREAEEVTYLVTVRRVAGRPR